MSHVSSLQALVFGVNITVAVSGHLCISCACSLDVAAVCADSHLRLGQDFRIAIIETGHIKYTTIEPSLYTFFSPSTGRKYLTAPELLACTPFQ